MVDEKNNYYLKNPEIFTIFPTGVPLSQYLAYIFVLYFNHWSSNIGNQNRNFYSTYYVMLRQQFFGKLLKTQLRPIWKNGTIWYEADDVFAVRHDSRKIILISWGSFKFVTFQCFCGRKLGLSLILQFQYLSKKSK